MTNMMVVMSDARCRRFIMGEALEASASLGFPVYVYRQAGQWNWSPYRSVAYCDSDLGTVTVANGIRRQITGGAA